MLFICFLTANNQNLLQSMPRKSMIQETDVPSTEEGEDGMVSQVRTETDKKLKYVKIYDCLYEMIQNKTFPPGSQLPSEKDLAERMNVSRMTLRKALALLQEDNLITNKTGIGNFVKDNSAEVPFSGMETIGHPIYKCCTQELNCVEIAFRIEPPTSPITKMLGQKSPAVVITDRWYKYNQRPYAYSLSFIPIEVIGNEKLDLNDADSLLHYLEDTIYKRSAGSRCTFSHSTAGNFTAAQYKLSDHASFILIQETIYGEREQVLAVSKHYIPIDLFKMELHIAQSSR